MAIDWDVLALPKGESASEGRRQRKLTKKQLLDDAYEEVDRLDGGVCWVTGRVTVKGATDPRVRRERHHSYGRRVAPEKRHDPNFIFTTCAEAHDLLTRDKLQQEGRDRREPVFFHWNLAPEKRPFHILEKRLRKQAVTKDGRSRLPDDDPHARSAGEQQ